METTLHQHLKESTRANHSSAEGHAFQGALTNAQLPQAAYVDYVQQLQALHSMYEAKLAAASKTDPHLQGAMCADYYQTVFLDRDLAALKAPTAEPVACIKEFVNSPQFEQHPVSMLGVLYVLLGAKHGGKFIAHNVKQGYKLDEAGYTYFNPYGENFRELWQKFTTSLNTLNLTPAERQAMTKAASDTFDVFGDIGEAVWNRMESKVR